MRHFLLVNETVATVFNQTDADAFLDDGENEGSSGFPYVALVLGVFAGLFVVFLTVGAFYYRRSKKVVLEADWKQRQEEKMMSEDTK